MIIKGKARGRARQLARHLSATDDNEAVRVVSRVGLAATSIEEALVELEAFGLRGRSQRSLYHASLSPEPGQRLTPEQISFAVDRLAEKLGLAGQPHIIVAHQKKGREHFHIVWSRIRADGNAISDAWNYRLHEQVSRELERTFGHRRVEGSQVLAARRSRQRPYEIEEFRRSGTNLRAIEDELGNIWRASGTGSEFSENLARAGYQLVRGDRRGYVVLDSAGEAHSLKRRLKGVTPKELAAKLRDVPLADLPSVKEGRAPRRRQRQIRNHATQGTSTITLAHFIDAKRSTRLRLFTQSRRAQISRFAIRREFAARIAAACEIGSKAEVTARIRRLREEEAAAVAALDAATMTSRAQSRIQAAFRTAGREVVRRRRPPQARVYRRPSGGTIG